MHRRRAESAASPVPACPDAVPSQWLRRFHGIGRSPGSCARKPDTSFFSLLGTLRDAVRKGSLAARGKPPGQAKPGVGGDTAWQLCVGTIGHPRLATSRATVVCNDPGRVVRVRRRFHRICRRWVKRKCVGLSSRTICLVLPGRRLPAPSDVQDGENFLSFAFFADPAQLAQCLSVRSSANWSVATSGSLLWAVHWSHRLAPENVLWLAPLLQESGTGAFANLVTETDCARQS